MGRVQPGVHVSRAHAAAGERPGTPAHAGSPAHPHTRQPHTRTPTRTPHPNTRTPTRTPPPRLRRIGVAR
eukprot:5091332-Pyramimonas_sp.AAC.2